MPGLCAIALVALLVYGVSPTSAVPATEVSFTKSPATSEPGTSGVLTFTMKNVGTATLHRSHIQLQKVDLPIQIPTERFAVGGAAKDQTVTFIIPFTVPEETPAGFYRAWFRVEYCESGTSDCDSLTSSTTIEVRNPKTLRLHGIEPQVLDLWRAQTLTFTVENAGAGTLRTVELSWTTTDDAILPVGSGNEYLISKLEPGALHRFNVSVAPSPTATPGVYPISVTLTAMGATGSEITETSKVGILVGGDATFQVSAERDGAGEITVSVGNVGVNPATSVVLRAWPDGTDRENADLAFLGDLDPGDFTTSTFQTALWFERGFDGSVRPLEGLVQVRIEYTDGAGIRQVTERTTNAALSSDALSIGDGAGLSPLVLFVLLAVALLGAGGMVVRVRRKRARARLLERFADDEEETEQNGDTRRGD